MATDAAALEVTTAEPPQGVVEAGTKQQHNLERKWTFWFDNQSKPKQQGAAWGSTLRKLYTFETVEEFWWYVILVNLKYIYTCTSTPVVLLLKP